MRKIHRKTLNLKQASNLLKKSAEFSKQSLLLIRPLSKDEKFRLNQIKKYLRPNDYKIVQQYLKQSRLKLTVLKRNFSFMVASSDLQPYLESNLEIITKINQILYEKFEQVLEDEFSSRAWQIIQEYVGGNILGMRNIKKILTLILLADEHIINLTNIPKVDIENFQNNLKSLGFKQNILFNSKDNENIRFEGETFKSNKFIRMAERIISGKQHKPQKEDLEFIKKYIKRARKINPDISAEVGEKIKEFIVALKKRERKLHYCVKEITLETILSLLKCSAKIELRKDLQTKDLERVFKLIC